MILKRDFDRQGNTSEHCILRFENHNWKESTGSDWPPSCHGYNSCALHEIANAQQCAASVTRKITIHGFGFGRSFSEGVIDLNVEVHAEMSSAEARQGVVVTALCLSRPCRGIMAPIAIVGPAAVRASSMANQRPSSAYWICYRAVQNGGRG